MKFKSLLLIVTVLLFQSCSLNNDKPSTANSADTRCTGKKNCRVCRDCSRCRHCHINGGSCGVCR